jgi:heme O synthase-like polyprenyltransferase
MLLTLFLWEWASPSVYFIARFATTFRSAIPKLVGWLLFSSDFLDLQVYVSVGLAGICFYWTYRHVFLLDLRVFVSVRLAGICFCGTCKYVFPFGHVVICFYWT